MAGRYRRPDWVRRVIAMGESVGGADRLVAVAAAAMIESASESIRSEDFGDLDNGDWQPPLRGTRRSDGE